MRVIVLVKATQDSEAGVMPSEEMLAAMMKYNEELAKAGILLDGNGLHPSARGVRVQFGSDGTRTVVDGPFAETKELVAGYWLWQVRSMDEAIEWVKRCPDDGTGGEIEIRQVYEAEDFGDALTPEIQEIDTRVRAKEHLNALRGADGPAVERQ